MSKPWNFSFGELLDPEKSIGDLLFLRCEYKDESELSGCWYPPEGRKEPDLELIGTIHYTDFIEDEFYWYPQHPDMIIKHKGKYYSFDGELHPGSDFIEPKLYEMLEAGLDLLEAIKMLKILCSL